MKEEKLSILENFNHVQKFLIYLGYSCAFSSRIPKITFTCLFAWQCIALQKSGMPSGPDKVHRANGSVANLSRFYFFI